METLKVNNKEEWDTWREDMKTYDYDFDPDNYAFVYPFLICYVRTESNGYPHIEYEYFDRDWIINWLQ